MVNQLSAPGNSRNERERAETSQSAVSLAVRVRSQAITLVLARFLELLQQLRRGRFVDN